MSEEPSILARTGMIPHLAQPSKGKTITTNTSNTTIPHQGSGFPEPPKSSLAITAALLLIIGFANIVLGLFIIDVLIPLSILGGAIIFSANVVAILSLRELS
jgi:hypothetical protein